MTSFTEASATPQGGRPHRRPFAMDCLDALLPIKSSRSCPWRSSSTSRRPVSSAVWILQSVGSLHRRGNRGTPFLWREIAQPRYGTSHPVGPFRGRMVSTAHCTTAHWRATRHTPTPLWRTPRDLTRAARRALTLAFGADAGVPARLPFGAVLTAPLPQRWLDFVQGHRQRRWGPILPSQPGRVICGGCWRPDQCHN